MLLEDCHIGPHRGRFSKLVRHEQRKAVGDSARLRAGVGSCGVLPKPSIKIFELHSVCLVEGKQERERVAVVELQPVAFDPQERTLLSSSPQHVCFHPRTQLGEGGRIATTCVSADNRFGTEPGRCIV